MTDEELEVLYDPLTRHAEYQRGQTVIYRTDGRRKIGEIMWITAPTPDHPTEYWIDRLPASIKTISKASTSRATPRS